MGEGIGTATPIDHLSDPGSSANLLGGVTTDAILLGEKLGRSIRPAFASACLPGLSLH